MGEAARRRIGIAEFLAWDGEGDRRYELVGGAIVAVAPPSNAHAVIVANAVGAIRSDLDAPCRVLSEVGIVVPSRDDLFYQADLAIACSVFSADARGIADPVVIVEVLSPSTAGRDRGVKLADYRLIGSVRDILLIASDRMRVEHWRRAGEEWTLADLLGSDRITLLSVGIEIAVAALYDGLDLSRSA
jgi:Uma2 family endonuclease